MPEAPTDLKIEIELADTPSLTSSLSGGDRATRDGKHNTRSKSRPGPAYRTIISLPLHLSFKTHVIDCLFHFCTVEPLVLYAIRMQNWLELEQHSTAVENIW